MLSTRNLARFVSINDLVSIERQAIFDFSRNAGHRKRERLVLQTANFTC